ncbi:ribonuclease H-like domain-containing protein [Tanacetum coccineum]
MTRRVLLRCDSTGDLYPVTAPSPIPSAFLVSHQTWHQRLGHPGSEVLRRLISNNVISCNKEKPLVLCHACQLGKHVRLPFVSSSTIVSSCFEIVHSDVWTSPILSLFGFKYYVLFLDHYSQFVWCDHGGEFDNHKLHELFNTNGIQFHFSFPKTSQQNGKSERMLEPRATPSIFLGHTSSHRGYRCLDLTTNKIILSRHVTFDETVFPYGSTKPALVPSYNFLDEPDISTSSISVSKPPITVTVTPNQTTLTNDEAQLPSSTTSPYHNPNNDAAQISPQAAHSPNVPSMPQSPIIYTVASAHSPTTDGTAQQTPAHVTSQSTSAQSTPNITHHAIIPDPPVNPNPTSVHPMVTCFRVGSNKPTQRLNFHVSSISSLPKSYRDAFHDSNWQNAMRDEYDALIKNSTWTLVPRPPDANVFRCMWLFRHKFLADGTLSRYKARLVANGSTQLEGVDVDDTFSPVVKPGTIRTTVYMHQPPGFRDSTHPDYVGLLQRSLYGLKQAPRAWFQRFASYITRVGFHHSRCDTSLFIYRQGLDTAYLLLYVDDIVLTASSSELLQRIIRSLHQEFAMTDLGPLNYFLGVSVTRDSYGLFLSQQKYAVEILEKAYTLNFNPSRTPIDTESKLGVGGDLVSGLTLYRNLAGSLQYLNFTRLDISYAVQQVCLYMHNPREPHLFALKRILRYVQGTLNYGLQLFSSSTTDLVAYSNAD